MPHASLLPSTYFLFRRTVNLTRRAGQLRRENLTQNAVNLTGLAEEVGYLLLAGCFMVDEKIWRPSLSRIGGGVVEAKSEVDVPVKDFWGNTGLVLTQPFQ